MSASETHNVEWKQSWHDEYLKWICGFANADGGTIYIGKDDKGRTVGVSGAKRLMEDIPNKIQSGLGIICDVRLSSEEAGDVIEIHVDRSPYPVNYRGEFHFRSGATKQVLKGNELTRFIFERTGLSWESVPVEHVDLDDLWRESFSIFKSHALASHRMTREDLECTDSQLLDKLELLEDGKLTRAGVLLFSHFPEKYVSQCYTRIALFENDADIRFEDEVHGSLLEQAERVIELLFQKYLVAPVSYDWMTRIERYPFHPDAVRELVYNALIHTNWARGIPIQIKVMPDRLYISNVAVPPRDLTVEKLLGEHRSEPYNPLIAKTFYRAGYIESWGRGIDKVRRGCKENGNPMATFMLEESGMMVRLDLPDWWPENLAVFGGSRIGGETAGLADGDLQSHLTDHSIPEESREAIDGDKSAINRRLEAIDGDKSAIKRRLEAIGGISRVERIYSLFDATDTISTSDVATATGLKASRAREVLAELVRLGLLRRTGGNRNSRYALPDEE